MENGQIETAQDGPRKRRGPVPGPPREKYTMMLEAVDAEWAKRQPGGMALLIRRLLREARIAAEGKKS
jgi:hypothetical protein